MLGTTTVTPKKEGNILCASCTIGWQVLLITPLHELRNTQGNRLDFDTLCSQIGEGTPRTGFPFLKRVIKLRPIRNDLAQPFPLLTIEPSNANRQSARVAWLFAHRRQRGGA